MKVQAGALLARIIGEGPAVPFHSPHAPRRVVRVLLLVVLLLRVASFTRSFVRLCTRLALASRERRMFSLCVEARKMRRVRSGGRAGIYITLAAGIEKYRLIYIASLSEG